MGCGGGAKCLSIAPADLLLWLVSLPRDELEWLPGSVRVRVCAL